MIDADKEKVKKTREKDNRLGTERRKFHYTACIPERRSGKDRRSPGAPLRTPHVESI